MAPAVRFNTAFDAVDPFSVLASQRHAAKFVTEVTNETKKAIREVITRAIQEGIPPKDAAKLIRPLVGLTSKHANAVLSSSQKQLLAGVPLATVQARAEKYSAKLLKYRAETIARTEIMRAQNAGQRAAWDDAAQKGLIGTKSQKRWIVAPDDRLCPICAGISGEEVPLDGAFSIGVTEPPAHPRCRCTVGLVPAQPRRLAATSQPGRTVADYDAIQARQNAVSDAFALKSTRAAQAAERQAALAAKRAAQAAEKAAAEIAAKAAAEAAAQAAAKAAEEARLLALANAQRTAEEAVRRAKDAAERKVGSREWIDAMLSRGRVTQQLGTNPGGIFQDAAGTRYYVKQYRDQKQALSEVVANRIYRDLKVGSPQSLVARGGDGHVYFASKIVENKGTIGKIGLTKKSADKILDGFAADVLTVNWDAVGTGLDNVVSAGTKVLRIDQGGTLMFRAQGGAKPTTIFSNIDEWVTFRTQNAYYSQVFNKAGLSSADDLAERAIKQIDAIEALSQKKGGWTGFVKRALGPNRPRDFETNKFIRETSQLLDARTRMLLQKRAQLQSLSSTPVQTVQHIGAWPIDDSVPRMKGRNLPAMVERQANQLRLDPTAKEAIRRYTGSAYDDANTRLWRDPSDLREADRAMQRALEAAKPPQGLDLVWRGLKGERGRTLTAGWKPGDIKQLNGFQSTSIDPIFAHNWGSSGGTLLEIKPARGLFVDHFSQNSGEMEFILPHAQSYRVIGRKTIRIKTPDGYEITREVIQLEML